MVTSLPYSDDIMATSRLYPGHTLALSWQQPGNTLATLWLHHCHMLTTSWIYPDHCLATSSTYPGHILSMPWPYPSSMICYFKPIKMTYDTSILFNHIASYLKICSLKLINEACLTFDLFYFENRNSNLNSSNTFQLCLFELNKMICDNVHFCP